MQDCQSVCQRFCDISVSERILNSLFLLTVAIGYLFSLGQIYFSHQGRDGRQGLSIEDVAIAYHGNPDQARLATAINGPMAGNLKSPADKDMILDWITSGAQREIYDSQIAPVLQRDCLGCHSPASGMNVPPLTSYEQVVKLTESDQGASIPSLVRVSHIHLFGIAFILFFVGKLFVYCEMPVWLKRLTIGIPFLSMLVDIFAWYLTRETPTFAYLLVVSGALMGLSLNFQIWLSLYQMWLPVSYYREFEAMVKSRYQALRDFMFYSEESVHFRQMLWRQGMVVYAYLREKVASWLNRDNLARQGERLALIYQNGIRRWR
ncbi:MAG: hypothetical protein ACXV7J_04460 [Methylomonas sp.]